MFEHETPFPEIQSYTVYLEPFLNTYYKDYQNILTVDRAPIGPIGSFVKRINVPPLSSFNTFTVDNCIHAFVRSPLSFTMKNNLPFLNERDIPSLLAFLKNNGYTVDMETVKIMHKAGLQTSGTKHFVCAFSVTNTP